MIRNLFSQVNATKGNDADAPTVLSAGVDADAYLKLDKKIKSMDLDMKLKTDLLDITNIVSSDIDRNTGTTTITLPSEVYTGLAYFASYTIAGGPASYNMRAPFDNIQYEIRQENGEVKTFTFTSDAINQFQKFMLKSQTIKDMYEETYSYVRDATSTSISQVVFLPLPGYLIDAPEQIISETMMPIRRENSSKLKLTFFTDPTLWCEFTGGVVPTVALTTAPEIRYSYISSQRSKDAIFKFFGGRRVPVWTTEVYEQTFDATGTSRSSNLEVGNLTSDIKFAGMIQALYRTTSGGGVTEHDTAEMLPIPIVSSGEIGLYRGKDQVLTGTSNALKMKSLNTFDCLSSEGVTASPYGITPIFVSASNPFNISGIARDYIGFGNSTKFKINIPNISSGLIATETYKAKATIFELEEVLY